MERLLLLLLAALSFGALLFIAATAPALPPIVATHFGAGGRPNGWMTRDGYTLFTLAFSVGLPWLVFAAIALLPSRWPRLVNLPHRDYWLAPKQRAHTLGTLRRFGAGIAAAIILLSVAMHALILDAHRRTPPRLDETIFIVLLVGFVVVLAVVAIRMSLRFRRLPG